MLRRMLTILGALLLVAVVAAGGLGAYSARRPWPQISGTVEAPGLQAAVEVYRDKYGVPHIYADSTYDLFFAQGFVHAQDRFWQMEFWRRIGQGRLSEVFGESTLDTDKFLRTLGWARVARQELEAAADPASQAILQAYADGVNAYLHSRQGNLGLEWTMLGLTGVKYAPEPWTPLNTLTWAKAMAWDLGGNMDSELFRARLIQIVGGERAAEYRPLYPADHPIVVPSGIAYDRLDTSLRAQAQRLDALLGGSGRGLGSNNWVIAGSRTASGMPLLANDPHLGIQMPSIWYEVGLHCRALTQDCPFEVAGFSFAGTPGVVIGHNNRIAWGFTNVGPDVQDLYVEKINPKNPNQYEVNGAWVDMQVIPETIKVEGQPEVTIQVRLTRHGPILNEVDEDVAALRGQLPTLDVTQGQAMALRWTALDPSTTFQAILQLNRAQNWGEFREALRNFGVPSQNVVYADVDGNIGYQMPGNIPVRAHGDGLLPVPGWTDEYEWIGYIPFDELPSIFNPAQGYIATANNAVVGPDYPYPISLEWDQGYRAQRIEDMFDVEGQITIDYIAQVQGDDANLSAQEITPYLLALSFDDPKLADAADRVRSWDFQNHMDSHGAAIYEAFWASLLAGAFHDELPQDMWPRGNDDSRLLVRNLLGQPDNAWWDNVTTPPVERRDDILRQAFANGYAMLEDRLGSNPERWTWGRLHTATFVNATLGKSGVAPIEAVFNRGPVAASGGESIVNATGYDLTQGFQLRSLPSMRMIVDLGNLGNSRTMHTTGQSGHPFNSHYADMIEPWRLIQYHPMLWDRAQLESAQEARLTLTP